MAQYGKSEKSKQLKKANNCLGNPAEIGIAVIRKVTNTAKALFNVDNYKEHMSLQYGSALQNIAHIYPYGVLPA